MKKLLLALLVVFIATSCRVTKSYTMMSAKSNSELTESDFINKKLYAVQFLELSQEQKNKATEIWKKEISGLKMPLLKNENIAPVIYNSEIEFRKLLTEEQKEKYKVVSSNIFLKDHQIEELKRIYNL